MLRGYCCLGLSLFLDGKTYNKYGVHEDINIPHDDASLCDATVNCANSQKNFGNCAHSQKIFNNCAYSHFSIKLIYKAIHIV